MKKFLVILPLLCFFCGTVRAQSWQELAPVPAIGRDDAVAFSLGGFGFVVTGNQGGFAESNRLWKYDPQLDSWTEKAPFPGNARQYAGSFVLDKEAYIIMGISVSGIPLNDVWKYNAALDQWTQLNDFPGEGRWSLFTFASPYAGYVGTGSTLTGLLSDVWKYDPGTDHWTQLNDFPGGTRRETVSFSIGEIGVVGLGYATLGGSNFSASCYSFNALTETWNPLADFPGGGRSYGNAVGTNAFGYVGTGQDSLDAFFADCYRFDPVSKSWEAINALPVTGIKGMSAFALEDTPYFLTGITDLSTRISTGWKLTNPSEKASIQLYPNPAAGEVIVKAQNGSEISLYTIDGHLLRTATVEDQQTCWFRGLSSGVYELRVRSGETMVCETLIVF